MDLASSHFGLFPPTPGVNFSRKKDYKFQASFWIDSTCESLVFLLDNHPPWRHLHYFVPPPQELQHLLSNILGCFHLTGLINIHTHILNFSFRQFSNLFLIRYVPIPKPIIFTIIRLVCGRIVITITTRVISRYQTWRIAVFISGSLSIIAATINHIK